MGHTVYIKDRIYIPAKIIDTYELQEKYEPQVYKEETCAKCEYLIDRHSDICDECPANLGVFKLYKTKEINHKKYYGINTGNRDWKNLLNTRKGVKVKDLRAKPEFRYNIKFKGKPYDYQGPPIKTITKKNNGVLKAPPRSGKTVMTTAAICGKGLRTIIIAKQYDWLQQFYDTIMGNKDKKERAFTNIPKLEKKTGKKICVLAKDGESIEKYPDADIVLCTYQRFLSKNGKKQLRNIKDKFGFVLVDEGDQAAAACFSKVMVKFSSRARMMCTATTDRKDGMYFLVEHIFGRVLHDVKVKTLKPVVRFIETGVDESKNYTVLAYAYRFLANHKKRNDLIIDWIHYDLNSNKLNSIVIPASTVKQCVDLVKRINSREGKEVAVAFTAGTIKTKQKREEVLAKAKSGEYRVVVGIRSMIQRGINIPRWNILYNVTPISNTPNYTQETARILTPMEGKPRPTIRHFVDRFGFTQGCLRGCLWNVYVPLKFKIDRKDFEIAKRYGTKNFKPGVTLPPGSSMEVKGKKASKKMVI